MTDHNLREIASTGAVHCEVRKIAYRQSKEGLVVSFVVHPDELPSALAVAPLGTRYMMALAQIGDDEQIVPASRHEVGERPLSVTRPVQQGVIHTPDSGEESVLDGGAKGTDQPGCGPKVPRPWHTIPAPERAGILCADARFEEWISGKFNVQIIDADSAADWLRWHLGIKSRAELATNDAARRTFDAIDHAYRVANGLEHEIR